MVVDLRYATPDNFTGQTLYSFSECYLCGPVARRLAAVQSRLRKNGLGLKMWDCYRPLSVQKKLWELMPDERYVANPKTGSRHNRGASVDVTLVDQTGKELSMPTAFDDFSPRAHQAFNDLPAEMKHNRETLRRAMEAEGFVSLPTEWWHFDDPGWNTYALRDDPLEPDPNKEEMASMKKQLQTDNVRQLIRVLSNGWDAQTGRLSRFEKKDGAWEEVGTAFPVSLGIKGMAWGAGLHPAGQEGPQKTERDTASPAGIFNIGHSYGYAEAPPVGAAWPYQQVDATWRCIDDPASSCYNQILSIKPGTKPDWTSAENMKREDHLYRWVINIEQNYPRVIPGGGSCLFLHVWRKEGSPTEGCTAMEEKNIVELLTWLAEAAHPHLIQLPKDVYESRKNAWGLP